MIIIICIFIVIVALFFIFNSIIWLKNKNIKNINDKIIKYTIYINFIIVSVLLLFLSYLYFYNLKLVIDINN
jgi:hypothetical protein